MSDKPYENKLEYTHRLWDNTLYWYSSAETKSQIVLGIDGAFLAFLTGNIFTKPDELRLILSQLNPLTAILLISMLICLSASTYFAIKCLWSRTLPHECIRSRIEKLKQENPQKPIYPPDVMWFFQFINLLDKDKFIATLGQIEPGYEIEALGREIFIVSKNVQIKHVAANWAFLLALVTLGLFFVSAVSFVWLLPPQA